MSCEQLSERLPDYWAGRLSDADRRALDAHLAECAACRDEAAALNDTWNTLGALVAGEPSAGMRGRFDAMVRDWAHEETHADANTGTGTSRDARRDAVTVIPMPVRTPKTMPAPSPALTGGHGPGKRPLAWRPVLQIAAALLVAAGGFAAGRVFPGDTHGAQLARTEITDLRQEVRDMRQMITLTLLQQQSASERLRGVNFSAQVDQPASVVLDALLDTLTHDSNVNVRLASIEALTKFGQDTRVRRSLIGELAVNRQDSPLVQIAIIDALVEMKEQQSVTALRTLAADQKANVSVRRRATWGADALTRSS